MNDSVLGNWWFQKNRKIRELAKGHTAPDDEELNRIIRSCSEDDLIRIWERSSALRYWLTVNGIMSQAISYWAHPETSQQISSAVLHVSIILSKSPYFLKAIATSPVKFLTPSGSTAPDLTQAKSVLTDVYQNLPDTHAFLPYADRAYKTANRWRSLGDVIRHWWYRRRHGGNLHPMQRGRELAKEVFNPELRKVTSQQPQEPPKKSDPPPAPKVESKTTPPKQESRIKKSRVVRNLSPIFDSDGEEVTPADKPPEPQDPDTLATGFRDSENAESESSSNATTPAPGANSTLEMSPAPQEDTPLAKTPKLLSTGPTPPSSVELRVKVLKNTKSPIVGGTPGSAPAEMSPYVDESAEAEAAARGLQEEEDQESAFERVEI